MIEHATLDEALEAAQLDARPVVKSARGGLQPHARERRRGEERPEDWWYYAPTEAVMEEGSRLLRLHGLTLQWEGTTTGPRGQVVTRWALRHRASGQAREYPYEAPPFADAETQTHAVLGTTRHAERAAHLLILKIPMVERANKGDVVEGGIIVRRTAADQVREVDAEEMPAWGNPDAPGAGGGLQDPGLLGGEDPEPVAVGLGDEVWRSRGEVERAQLADDADAAALGLPPDEPRAVVDNAALVEGLARRGERLGVPPGPERLDSAIAAALARVGQTPRRVARLTPEIRELVVGLLQEEGDLP